MEVRGEEARIGEIEGDSSVYGGEWGVRGDKGIDPEKPWFWQGDELRGGERGGWFARTKGTGP